MARGKAWDRRRRGLRDVDGVEEIVELFVVGTAHIHQRQRDVWAYEFLDDLIATRRLPRVGPEIPLGEIYASVDIPSDEVENLTS